jgi:hypothetical protein
MSSRKILYRALMFGAAVVLYSAAGMVLAAFGAEAPKSEMPKPVSGQQVHFPDGTWSGVPQPGPDGKVRQCVMIAPRPRAGSGGQIDTAFGLIISAGSGLTLSVTDDKVPPETILDDEGEIVLDGKSFPAVAFTLGGNSVAFHPGDAAGVLDALKMTKQVQLRSDGAGIDTGPIALALPGDGHSWLRQCGTQFKIALDKPTDPNAPALPVPRPHSPEIATPAGPSGIEDKQKISGWDASELRGDDGRVQACMIRAHYTVGGPNGRTIATFLVASRSKGLTMLLKDSSLDLPVDAGTPLTATLKIDNKPFSSVAAEVEGHDEIAIFPNHGRALAAALGDGAIAQFDALKVETMTFPVVAGVVPWLRACTHRWGFSLEPDAKG